MSCLFPEEWGWGRTPTIGWWSGDGNPAASVKHKTHTVRMK